MDKVDIPYGTLKINITQMTVMTKGEQFMKRSLGILLLLLIMAGCGQPTISLPAIDEHHILITHIKEPILAVVDKRTQDIVHQEELEFSIHSLAKIGDHQVALAGKHEKKVLLLDLLHSKLHKLPSSFSAVTDLLYDDVHGLLFITDAIRNEVIFWDMDEEKIRARVQVGSYPAALAIRDQALYVLKEDDAAVSIIDILSESIVQTFSVVERPTDVVVDGDYVWVGGHGSFSEMNEHIYVYDASTGAPVGKVKVGLMPIALYADQYSEDVWVISHGSNELHWVDKHTFDVKGKIQTGENPYYITADSTSVYITALDGDKLTVLDRQKGEIRKEIELLSGPYGIVLGGNKDE